jgi:hypothetical protein
MINWWLNPALQLPTTERRGRWILGLFDEFTKALNHELHEFLEGF